MRIIETISDIGQVKKGGVLTIGNFDGVHIGHRKILSAARKIADERGEELVLMTFEPHPLAVLHPERAPAILTPRVLKRHLLEQMDVDVRLVLSCGAEVFSMSAGEFVRRFLAEGVRPCVVVEGEDFNFGEHFAVTKSKSEAELYKSKKIKSMFRFICPSNYISGIQE